MSFKPSEYLNPLVKLFQQNKNDEHAIKMAKYMKNHFTFYGIKSPIRKELQKEFWNLQAQKQGNKNKYPTKEQLPQVLEFLWNLPQREYQYTAMDLMDKTKRLFIKKGDKESDKEGIVWVEHFIVTKSWWDTVDLLAAKIAGFYFQQFPDQIEPITEEWNNSPNMWLNRSAILFQLKYKKQTDSDRLFRYIQQHKASKEFFIQKAIGWSLRQYGKSEPQKVRNFVNNNELASLSRREATRLL